MRKNALLRLVSPLAALLLSACAAQPLANAPAAPVAADPRDRSAILAMAGEYEVTFQFDETLALKPGYTLHKPHRSIGQEFVLVLEDAPHRISLQHVLVMGGHVVKHWRQDWEYEQTRSWAYAGDNTWERRERKATEVQGRWTQTVWQVDDSPRYAGSGRWIHDHGFSAWTSEPDWRPLPRREHTTRNDYDGLLGINRHSITPDGWSHEQDNLKIDRNATGGAEALARETGMNRYRRIQGHDFAPGYAYWQRTQDYWRTVREVWTELFAENASIRLKPDSDAGDGQTLHEAMAEQAERLSEARPPESELRTQISALIDRYRVL